MYWACSYDFSQNFVIDLYIIPFRIPEIHNVIFWHEISGKNLKNMKNLKITYTNRVFKRKQTESTT